MIRKYLLDNTHGAIVVVKPEKGRTARMDRELEEKLEALKDSLSDAQKERLVEQTKELEDYQSQPDRPEDIEEDPRAAEDGYFPGDRAYHQRGDDTCRCACCVPRDLDQRDRLCGSHV